MKANEDNLILALMETESALSKSFDLSNKDERNRMETLVLLKKDLESKLQESINDILNHRDTMRSPSYLQTNYSPRFQDNVQITRAISFVGSDLFKTINSLDYDCFYYIRMANADSDELSGLPEFQNTKKLSMLSPGNNFSTSLTTGKTLYTIIGGFEFTNNTFLELIKGLDSLIETSFKENPKEVAVFFNFESGLVNFEIKRIYLNLIIIVLLTKMIQYQNNNKMPKVTFLLGNEQEEKLFQKILSSYQRQESAITNKIWGIDTKLDEISKKCLTQDPKYKEILRSILYILDEEDIPILILGESGVGKSYLAKSIHDLSNREKKKYAQINCGILSGDKMYQQIWGWEEGSFTGATKGYDGLIKRADQGTFFIDEIDRASGEVRNAILTFVENKTYEKLGGSTAEEAHVRLIFGSNKNLKKIIQKGLFEKDLYARIAGRIVNIPPLRDRKDDIDLLVNNFLYNLNETKQSTITIDNNALDYLKTHSWPLNIRELQQYIKIVFHEVNMLKEKAIKKEHFERHPFEDLFNSRLEEFEELIELLKSFLIVWDKTDGKFLEEIIYPIVAKIYKDDYSAKFTKGEVWNSANDIIGISGLNHNKSSLMKFYNKFENIKEKLKLN